MRDINITKTYNPRIRLRDRSKIQIRNPRHNRTQLQTLKQPQTTHQPTLPTQSTNSKHSQTQKTNLAHNSMHLNHKQPTKNKVKTTSTQPATISPK